MKQVKLLLTDLNDPKKLAASLVFALVFFAFIWELISGFRATEQIKTINNPLNARPGQVPLSSHSAPFTVALFGDYVPINLSEADIKQSMLDVELVGIMYSANEKESQVIIRAGGGEEKSYLIGDTLPGGAVIKRISEKGVVVLHNGALESLSLPKNELIFEAPAKPLIEE